MEGKELLGQGLALCANGVGAVLVQSLGGPETETCKVVATFEVK